MQDVQDCPACPTASFINSSFVMIRRFNWKNMTVSPAKTYIYFLIWVMLCDLHATHSSAFVTSRIPTFSSILGSGSRQSLVSTRHRDVRRRPGLHMSWLSPKRQPSLGGEWFNIGATSNLQETQEIGCWVGETDFGRYIYKYAWCRCFFYMQLIVKSS